MNESPTISIAELSDLTGLTVEGFLANARQFYANLPLLSAGEPKTPLGIDTSESGDLRLDVETAQELVQLLVEEKLASPVLYLSARLEDLAQTKRQLQRQRMTL